MEYKSVAQMAEQWGISERRVRILCQQGKITGVIRRGRTWLIPSNEEKPDRRAHTSISTGVIADMQNSFSKVDGSSRRI